MEVSIERFAAVEVLRDRRHIDCFPRAIDNCELLSFFEARDVEKDISCKKPSKKHVYEGVVSVSKSTSLQHIADYITGLLKEKIPRVR